MAIGNIHIGTMAGKLNGVIPATTPSGCRIEYASTPGGDVLREPALEQVRDPAGELDHLEPAGDLARRVGGHLAVLGADQRGQLGLPRRGAARGTRTSRSARLVSDVSRQPGQAPAAAATAASTSAAEAKSTVPVTCPVAGL